MSPTEPWFPGHLVELSTAECLEELAAHRVGRVAHCDPDGPVLLPVNYVMDGESVLLRVSPRSALASRLRSGPVSFQVDEFDEFTQTGWSVLLRGHASYVEADEHPVAARLQSWPEGQRTVLVRLAPEQVTGRRLLEA